MSGHLQNNYSGVSFSSDDLMFHLQFKTLCIDQAKWSPLLLHKFLFLVTQTGLDNNIYILSIFLRVF